MERHIFKCCALKRSFVQRRPVKLDANEGQSVQALPSQVTVFEVHAVKGTVLKDCLRKVESCSALRRPVLHR